jgi:methionine-rich copper-binding protein CopC/uncharacterized membrane protein
MRRLPLTAGLGRWIAPAGFLLLIALLPVPAWAHGALRGSSPANGAHLSAAPRELRLTFSERVELAVARLQLVGPDSAPVPLGPLALEPDSANVLVGEIRGALRAGAYTVAWQVAGPDGHPVRGRFTFVIAPGAAGLGMPQGPTAPGQATPPPGHHPPVSLPTGEGFDAESPLYVAVRWLSFLGIVGVLGAVAFRGAVLPLARRRDPGTVSALAPSADAGVARIGTYGAVLVLLAAALRLLAQSYALHGRGGVLDAELVGTMLSRTVWGWGWILQAAAAVVALVAFRRAARHGGGDGGEDERDATPTGSGDGAPEVDSPAVEVPAAASETPTRAPAAPRSTGGAWGVAALGALALAVTPALSGHAASAPRLTAVAIVADALHVVGAGGWIGGLLVLIAAGVPAARALPEGERGRGVAALVNAFSPTALAFAATLALTGVFAAWLHVGTFGALWGSAYGKTLLLKLGLLTAVFGTGAYNWLRVRPALGGGAPDGPRRLRRSAAFEIAVGVVVLLVTAALVATATPVGM